MDGIRATGPLKKEQQIPTILKPRISARVIAVKIFLVLFKNYGLGTIYGFIAVGLTSFSINVVSGLRVSPPPSQTATALQYGAGFLAVSGILLFLVSLLLEGAKHEWIADGMPRDPDHMWINVEKRILALAVALILSLVSLVAGLAMFVPSLCSLLVRLRLPFLRC